MKIKPKFHRILVEPKEKIEKTANGILIPETAQEEQIRGKVIEVADNVTEIKAGDEIIYPKNCGTPIGWEDKTLLVMREHDVLCVISSKSEPTTYVTNSTSNIFDS